MLALLTLACSCSPPAAEVARADDASQPKEVELVAAGVTFRLEIPTDRAAGDLVSIPYEIENTASGDRGVVVGGCQGPIMNEVVSESGSRRTSFYDRNPPSGCNDVRKVVTLRPGDRMMGVTEWHAGAFAGGRAGDRSFQRGDATIEVEVTALADRQPESATHTATITVR